MNIYIGNLSYNVTEDSLRSIFEEFGEIESAKVTMDRLTGRSKGFGFVEMPSNSKADQAIIFTKEKDIDLFYRGR